MKPAFFHFTLFWVFCFIFSNVTLKAQTDKQLIKKLDSLERNLENRINLLPQLISSELQSSKKSEQELNNVRMDLANYKKQNKELGDSIKNLNDTLVVTRSEINRLKLNLAAFKEDKIQIENLTKQIKEEKSLNESQVLIASKKAREEEKNKALNNFEILATKMLASSALVDAEALNAIAAEIVSIQLQNKLTKLKQQSQILNNALLFLDKGEGKFTDVYEALVQTDFDSNSFPAQYQLQQNVKNRFVHFFKTAARINEDLVKLVNEPNSKMRDLKLSKTEISIFLLEAYPYLDKKWEENRIKNVSLDIDAKYLNIE
jgi:hypothetical protein